MQSMISYSVEVQQALAENKPIVALESTIISHGMPYPQNVHTARIVEQIIREQGAVPATIAIIEGKIRIGLSAEQLEDLGRHSDVVKVSKRDIGAVIALRKMGATTVAATMLCAALAGIRIFVTGGIGGVHRGAETSMDISADLEALSQTSVAVVCAGVKSILDIGLTLEYLETQGVPVIGYKTHHMPAFYTRSSEFTVSDRSDEVSEIARILKSQWDLGIHTGAVIANPIPEEHAMDEHLINHIIEQALQEASSRHIQGKAVTPFLLGKIKELTEGRSLVANIELVKHNARVGAALAVAYAELI